MLCYNLFDRAWERSAKAHHHAGLWKPWRYVGEVLPVIAAAAGGTLVGHVHGTAAAVIGWIALTAGLAGAAINALRPASGYQDNADTAAHLERLAWNVWTYPRGRRRPSSCSPPDRLPSCRFHH